MKIKGIIAASLAAAVLAGASSCSKDKFNINSNPNSPTDSTITYDVILPAALHNTGGIVARDWGWLQNWMGYWARSGTYAANITEETYQITTNFQTIVWSDLYNNLYDYEVMRQKAEKAGADFYAGIAYIMKAHNYGMLVDIYNNVPYKQALQGNANITPAYDKGLDIYKDLMIQLDSGIVKITRATAATNKNIFTNDIMFGNPTSGTSADIPAMKTKWIQFANTLRLRLLMHLTTGGYPTPANQGVVAGIDIPTEIAKIDANGAGYLIDNAVVNPGYKSDKPNPFYNTYINDITGQPTANNTYYSANAWAIGYYDVDGDPRLSRFYTAGANGYVGVPYGLPPTNENSSDNLASIGSGMASSYTSPQWILTSAESYLIQAEAQQRGFLAGTPELSVYFGIVESFKFLGVANPTTAAGTYLGYNAGYPDVDINATALAPGLPDGGLFTILSQKMFALNAIAPYEVWTDYRRTDVVYGTGAGYDPGPPISVAPQNTATHIPVRLLYPQSEYNYNSGNVAKEGTINQFNSRIFWDVQ